MFGCYLKQNVNFIETLFTEHYYINPHYTTEWAQLQYFAEKIARYCPYDSVNCMVGMMREKERALCRPYPSKLDLIEKHGYDSKQLMHIQRLAYMFDDYTKQKPYAELLRMDWGRREHLWDIKAYCYSLAEAQRIAKQTVEYYSNRKAELEYTKTYNSDINRIFDETLLRILKQQFYWDLQKGAT